MNCKHYTTTPYGPACDSAKTFIRSGDLILCEGCGGFEPLTFAPGSEVIPKTRGEVKRFIVLVETMDGTIRQARLTAHQEALVVGVLRSSASGVSVYNRKLKVNLA